jgi:hypothetical protein
MANVIVWDGIYRCTAKDCCCGKPVNIRRDHGRNVPYHVR